MLPSEKEEGAGKRCPEWATGVKSFGERESQFYLDCPRILVMKHFNTCNVRSRDILEPLTPKSKLSNNWCYTYALCKAIYISFAQIGDWGNILIRHLRDWKHWKHSPWACPFSAVEFRGSFLLSKNKYCSSCFRFGSHIISTVIVITHESTHKATRQSVWNRFYW